MLSLFALVALAVLPRSFATTANLVQGDSLQYFSGDFPSTESEWDTMRPAVNEDYWHDTSVTPLVLRLSIMYSSDSALAAPSASLIQIHSVPSSSTASAVSVSSPFVGTFAYPEVVASASSDHVTISEDVKFLNYTLTFNSNAYGTYKISYLASSLQTANGGAFAFTSVAGNVPAAHYVNVGFVPKLSIVNAAGADVTAQWLDPTDLSTGGTGDYPVYKAKVGVSKTTSTKSFNLTQVISYESSIPSVDLQFDGTIDATVSATAILFTLGLDQDTPGVSTVVFPQGSFQRSDGVYSVESSLDVKIGFYPQVFFRDSCTNNNNSADTSSYEGSDATFWFKADESIISLRVQASGTVDAFDGDALAVPYGISANQLLYGLSALPGVGRSITSYASTKPGVNDYYDYSLSINGLVPGSYSFPIPSGVFVAKNGADLIGSCAVTAVLRIGYVPSVKLISYNYDTGSERDVSGTWLDSRSDYEGYRLRISPGGSNSFAADSFDISKNDALVWSNSEIQFDDPNVENGGLISPSAVDYDFSFVDDTVPGMWNVNINAGEFMRSGSVAVYNTFTSIPVKQGFALQAQVTQGAYWPVYTGEVSYSAGDAVIFVSNWTRDVTYNEFDVVQRVTGAPGSEIWKFYSSKVNSNADHDPSILANVGVKWAEVSASLASKLISRQQYRFNTHDETHSGTGSFYRLYVATESVDAHGPWPTADVSSWEFKEFQKESSFFSPLYSKAALTLSPASSVPLPAPFDGSLPAFSSSGLFKGSVSIFGSTNFATFAAGSASFWDESCGLYDDCLGSVYQYPLELSSLKPGFYDASIAAGVICTSGPVVCNGPVPVFLNMGFDMSYSNEITDETSPIFGDITDEWFDINADFQISLSSGNGFSFVSGDVVDYNAGQGCCFADSAILFDRAGFESAGDVSLAPSKDFESSSYSNVALNLNDLPDLEPGAYTFYVSGARMAAVSSNPNPFLTTNESF